MVPDTAVLLLPIWEKQGVTGVQTLWSPSHGLTDTLTYEDNPDLSPLWAPSDFFPGEEREENATANSIIQKKTF